MIERVRAINRKDGFLLFIVAGIFFACIAILSPGTAFDISLVLLIIISILHFYEGDEKIFLIKLFIAGITVRVFLMLAIQFSLYLHGRYVHIFGDKALYLFGDDGYYTLRSWWMAQHFSGKALSGEVLRSAFDKIYGNSSYLYVMAFFYYFFGFSPISAIFINCIFSVLTGFVYYKIAKDITDIKSAQITGSLIVFFPSLIIWSVVNLKDSLFIFITGLIILVATRAYNIPYVPKLMALYFLAWL